MRPKERQALSPLLGDANMRSFTPLEHETRAVLPTREAALHLNRQPQTLRMWASSGRGPLQPRRIHGRLAWPVAEIRRVLEGGAE